MQHLWFGQPEGPHRLVVDCREQGFPIPVMDQFQVSYVAVENEAIGSGRYRLESAMAVTAKQETIGGVVTARERRSLVFIACEDQVGMAISVDVRADDGIHGRDLGHKGERMKSEMPMAIVLEPAAARLFCP